MAFGMLVLFDPELCVQCEGNIMLRTIAWNSSFWGWCLANPCTIIVEFSLCMITSVIDAC